MPTPSFFLPFEAHGNERLWEFRDTLYGAESKRVADVTIADLCAMSEHPNGLYFFFGGTPRDLQYVGKCTSRSFVERIPSHFDQREDAWFNTLPTRLVSEGVPYASALQSALEFHVVLFGVKDNDVAKELERVFRHAYLPVLNTPRRLLQFDERSTLAALCGI